MRSSHRILIAIVCVSVAMGLFGCGKDKNKPPTDLNDPWNTGSDPSADREIPSTPPPPPPSSSTADDLAGQDDGRAAPPLALDDVRFDFDTYALSTEARSTLAENARMLESRPEIGVTIEGHCDERGTIEYNLALGEKRAQAVKDYLARYGIESRRLWTVSYGEERPLSSEPTEAAWAKNRRAHLRER